MGFSGPIAFGFGSWAMLGWLAVAAAPLVIHLLNRRRYDEVPWAAMEYLMAALRKSTRRMRIEQLLLLLLRIAILALLVTAIAEPYLESARLIQITGQRAHKLLVIDGSFSMGIRPADKSCFDRAKEVAAQIVAESQQGDGFTLVIMADPPRVVVGTPAFEPGDFEEELQNLTITHGGGDLARSMVEVEAILNRVEGEYSRLARQEVYFLSDLQRRGWEVDLGGEATAEFRERMTRIDQMAELVVIDLGQKDVENLAISSVRVVDSFVTISGDVTLEVTLDNFGRRERTAQLLELYVDTRRAGEQTVNLAPGESRVVNFSYRFDTGGDHQIEVRLPGDLLEIDNHRWLSVPVRPHLRVLCVDGRPAGGDLRGTTHYLAVALAPENDSQRSVVLTEVVAESAVLEIDLFNYDAIFLCNVAQFTGSEARVLDRYLRDGGGLIFFLGEQVQAESYNWHLAGDDPDGVRILPARLSSASGSGEYRFDPLAYEHPLVRVFRGQEQSGLLTAPVRNFFHVDLVEGSRARVALGFDNGAAAIVEEDIHRGRSLLITTTADASWTDLPLTPSFLPLIQEILALAVTGQIAERNVLVGEAVGWSVRTSASSVPVQLLLPDGTGEEIRMSAEGAYSRWTFSETWQNGAYVAEFGTPLSLSQRFSVNLDASESDLEKLDATELSTGVWGNVEFIHQTTWQDLEEASQGELAGHSRLHVWLLYCVLALLAAETILAWRFGHHRT